MGRVERLEHHRRHRNRHAGRGIQGRGRRDANRVYLHPLVLLQYHRKKYYYTYHSNYGGEKQTKKVYSPLAKAGTTTDGKQRYNSTADPWYNQTTSTETVTPAHKEYRTRTRTRSYLIGRWGEWSDWSAEAVEPGETREVQSRTVSLIDVPDTAVNAEAIDQIAMLAGTGTQLTAPSVAGAVQWMSPNPSVAHVDASGYLTAHAAGDAVIYGKDDRGVSVVTLEVTVLDSADMVPAGLTAIESEAFAGAAFESIDLRNAPVASIGSQAFADCARLRLVLTNSRIGSIAADAFARTAGATIAAEGDDAAFRFARANGLPGYVRGATRPFVPVSGVSISETSLTLVPGESVPLQATVFPASASVPYVAWLVMGDAFVVDAGGLVTAVKPGAGMVSAMTVDGSNESASCTVQVLGVPVEAISLSAESLTLKKGASATLTAAVEPANATNPLVAWYSSDPGVASVVDGAVTAIAPGSAVITVESLDNPDISASCLVTVQSDLIVDDSKFTNITADSITATDATIRCKTSVSPNPDLVGFHIGTSSTNLVQGGVEDLKNLNGNPLTDIWYNMKKWGQTLKANTTYYYRFYMIYGSTTYVSSVKSFKTSAAATTVVDDSKYKSFTVDNITQTNATIRAYVSLPHNPTAVGFYFGTTNTNLTKRMTETNIAANLGQIYYNLNDKGITLQAGTVYYYRFFMVYDGVTYLSNIRPFSTLGNVKITATSPTLFGLEPNETMQLSATVTPSNATLTWKSLSPSVATVSSSGLVTGVSEGFTLIELTATAGGQSAVVFYTVEVNAVKMRVFVASTDQYQKSLIEGILSIASGGNLLYEWCPVMGNNRANIINAYSNTSYVGAGNTKACATPKTAQVVYNDLVSFLDAADNNDISLIYFGAHGGNPKDGPYGTVFSSSSPKSFFLTDYDTIANTIKGIKIFIVDTCFSGAVVEHFQNENPRNDVIVLSAVSSTQYMRAIPGDKATYLVYYFLKGIGYNIDSGNPNTTLAADTSPKDGKVTFHEIYQYVSEEVVMDTVNRTETEERYTIRREDPQAYCPSALWSTVIYQRDSR